MSYEIIDREQVDKFHFGNVELRTWYGGSIAQALEGRNTKGFLHPESKGKLNKNEVALISTSEIQGGKTHWLSVEGKKVGAQIGSEAATIHEPQDAAGAMILPFTNKQGKYEEILVAAIADGVSMSGTSKEDLQPSRDSGGMASAAVKRAVTGVAELLQTYGKYDVEDVYRFILDKFTSANLVDGGTTLNLVVAFPHKAKPGHIKVHCHTLGGKADNGPVIFFDGNGRLSETEAIGSDTKSFIAIAPELSPEELVKRLANMTTSEAWTLPPGTSIGFSTDGVTDTDKGDDVTLLKVTAK